MLFAIRDAIGRMGGGEMKGGRREGVFTCVSYVSGDAFHSYCSSKVMQHYRLLDRY